MLARGFLFWNMYLDEKSASLLMLPTISRVIIGDTPIAFIAKNNMRISRAVRYDFADIFLIKPTVGVLSQNLAMVLFLTSMFVATKKKEATNPSASISEFVTPLFPLRWTSNVFWTSYGKPILKVSGLNSPKD